ncbi:hypothetical protein Ato02nite_087350 [Paractinoplanes toevensis]|uniref:Uncharacterized protein n=1 Tax=Paractinoplanes toevensis TaxID=571911 RepID=A0A920BPQ2_9ACTN|nr:hypothetical protein Ato02nite_087350 [Actinoplanes toevensis]
MTEHRGARAGATGGQPFVDEPLVGLDDDTAGDPQLGGQHPGGREAGAGSEAAAVDGVSQPGREPGGQALDRGLVGA